MLKISQYSLENNCVRVTCVIKKRLQHRCFPVNVAKFLRAPILNNICQQLLLLIYDVCTHPEIFWNQFATILNEKFQPFGETYSEPCKTNKIEFFGILVNNFQPLSIFAKISILDVWLASKCVSVGVGDYKLWTKNYSVTKILACKNDTTEIFPTILWFKFNQNCNNVPIYFDALQLSEANWNDKREHQNETGY